MAEPVVKRTKRLKMTSLLSVDDCDPKGTLTVAARRPFVVHNAILTADLCFVKAGTSAANALYGKVAGKHLAGFAACELSGLYHLDRVPPLRFTLRNSDTGA